jgi:hypothetical protein
MASDLPDLKSAMEGSHQCPEVAEAFFGTGCDVHLSACMTPDDLQSGLGWSPD